MLLTEDLTHFKPSQIRSLAQYAWGDKRRAGEFAANILRQRLEAVERE